MRDSEGKPLHFIAVVEDLTERKQAELERIRNQQVRQELNLLEQVLERVLAGYWDWNLVDNTQYLSPRFKEMFGYKDYELPNSPDFLLLLFLLLLNPSNVSPPLQ